MAQLLELENSNGEFDVSIILGGQNTNCLNSTYIIDTAERTVMFA